MHKWIHSINMAPDQLRIIFYSGLSAYFAFGKQPPEWARIAAALLAVYELGNALFPEVSLIGQDQNDQP